MDDATIVCFELLHEIAPPARVNTYPDIDFLSSLSPAKSISEY
jgi:hypothetical protein